MRHTKKVLVIITILAAILRFYRLGVNPPSLTWDEVAWGYNAYTIGIDARDEFGRLLPVDYLESFGDYKPPAYAYLTVLPVKMFGLTEFAVRFPSALFGTITILITYFLVKELLYSQSRFANSSGFSAKVGLLSALLLAISPWHINLSRAAFEANVSSFFIVAGIWLFIYSMRKQSWYIVLSFIFLVLSLYTFNTARIFTPIMGFILIVSGRRNLIQMKKKVAVSAIVALIISVPVITFMLTPQAKLRYHEVNIFSDLSIVENSNKAMQTDYIVAHKGKYCPECEEVSLSDISLWSRIIHNRRYLYMVEYLRHYFHHFNPSFLFIHGDGNPKFSTGDVGQLYIVSLPFLIYGSVMLVRKKNRFWWIIPVWLLTGIIPAATARETAHALRIETTLPTFQIIIAYGLVCFYEFLSKHLTNKRSLQISIFIITSTYFLNTLYYLQGYYIFYPGESSREWQYGYKQAISYIKDHYNDYDTIAITDALGRPYVYMLFHLQVDPREYRSTADFNRDVYGIVDVKGFDKFRFSNNPKDEANGKGKALVLDLPDRVPDQVEIVKEFMLLNGEPILVAYRL